MNHTNEVELYKVVLYDSRCIRFNYHHSIHISSLIMHQEQVYARSLISAAKQLALNICKPIECHTTFMLWKSCVIGNVSDTINVISLNSGNEYYNSIDNYPNWSINDTYEFCKFLSNPNKVDMKYEYILQHNKFVNTITNNSNNIFAEDFLHALM
jgi:hypothetical protein